MSFRRLTITYSVTNRDSESVKKYLNEISRIRPVTPEEEVQLAERIQQGDKAALDALVRANLRFVISVAKQFQQRGVSLCDLINEGNIGLIEAAKRFDPTRGFKFISFAVWWIRQAIVYSLSGHTKMIKIPLNKVNLLNQVLRASATLEAQLERTPTAEEIAAVLAMDVDIIEELLQQSQVTASLDSPFGDEEGSTMLDVLTNDSVSLSDTKVIHYESLSAELRRALSTLSLKQKQVICYYFGIGLDMSLSLDDIAWRLNLSRERVRQIKEKGLVRLRSSRHAVLLRGYL